MKQSFYLTYKTAQNKPDTNLEIALALSASLAQTGDQATSSLKNAIPEIIFPEATVWPISYDRATESKSKNVKTVLQVC
jgi:hypothetical protein